MEEVKEDVLPNIHSYILHDGVHRPDEDIRKRITLKNSANPPIKTNGLATVMYGTIYAPFVTSCTFLQLAKDEKENLSSLVVKTDFYVYNIFKMVHQFRNSHSDSAVYNRDHKSQLVVKKMTLEIMVILHQDH
ncbi:hypothetical protein TNCV_544401 [Trichonephila clavipes]|nr:hypothetical protein TNCV_544401 [Trichonephila clavipes]